MKGGVTRVGQFLRQNPAVGVAVGLGVALSVLLSFAARSRELNQLQEEFRRQAEDRVGAVRHELEERVDDLKMLGVLCGAKPGLKPAEFEQIARALRAGDSCVQAFEWMPRVPGRQREEFEQAARRCSFRDPVAQRAFSRFQITELGPNGAPVRAADREEYFPVYYLEPLAGNEAVLGFDAVSEERRRQVITRTLASGEVTASPGLRLVQEPGQERGILLELPVYEAPATAAASGGTNQVRGLVMQVLRVGDFVESSLCHLQQVGIDVLVLDGPAAGPEGCLHTRWSTVRRGPPPASPLPLAAWRQGLYHEARVPVADREWLLVFKPTSVFLAAHKTWVPEGLLLAGCLLTGMLAGYLTIHARRAAQLVGMNKKLELEVAERRRAEQALRLPQFALDNASEAIFWVGADARFSYVNKAAGRLLGYGREELLGLTMPQVEPACTPDVWAAHWERGKQERFLTRQGTFRTRHGGLVAVELTTNHFEYEGQQYSCTFVRDITRRKQAEEALRAAEQRWRTIFEYAPDAYYLNNLEGVFIAGNKAAEDTIGYSREELLGRNFLQLNLLLPEQLAKAAAGLARNAQGEATGPEEFTLCRKDGRQVPVEVRTYPVRLGEQVLVLGIARDITERKAAETFTRTINALLQLLPRKTTRSEYLDAVVALLRECTGCRCVGIRILDARGYLPYESQVGFSPEFWAAENWLSVAHDRCACTRVLTGQPLPADRPAITPGGSFCCPQLQAFARELAPEDQAHFRGACIAHGFESLAIIPIRHREQTVGAIHLADETPGKLSRPLAELLETMAPLIGEALHKLRMEEEVRASLQEKEILLKEVHHRVKNNLQVISSLLELQAASLHRTDPLKAFQESRLRVKTMAMVHEKLYQSADLARIDFAAYTRGLTSLLLSSYGKGLRGLKLTVAIEQAALGVVQAIPCGLIINELVSNALKHAFPTQPCSGGRESALTSPGEGQSRLTAAATEPANEIEVGLRRQESHWVLWVRDNGVGLPAGVDLTASTTASLGLTIVSLLARQLGGCVEVTRQGGTTFTITFTTQ